MLALAGPAVLCPSLRGVAWHLLAGLNLALLLAFGIRYGPLLVLGPLLLVPADLPQLSGPDLALRLRAARPELRVLYVVEADAPRDGSAGVPLGGPRLGWPTGPHVLAARLRAVLAAPPAPS